MASKRKCDCEEERGAVSKIPSLLKANISIVRDAEKENQPGNVQHIHGIKRPKIETSTPKLSSTTDRPNFKAPRAAPVLRSKAAASVPSIRSKVTAKKPAAATKASTSIAPTSSSSSAAQPTAATVAPATSTTGALPLKPTKRKAWDVKGRLADLEADMQVLLSRNKEITNECQVKGSAVADLEGKVQQYEDDISTRDHKISEMRARVAALESEARTFNLENQTLKSDLSYANTCVNRLQDELSKADLNVKRLQYELAAKTTEVELNNRRLDTVEEQLASISAENERISAELEEKEQLLRFSEGQRKVQHNLILELKGNIRVFCRVRPTLADEATSTDFLTFQEGGNGLTVAKPLEANEVGKNRQRTEFKFDKVFTPESSQELVFEEISQLVQSALDGYNVCIFAYGQTGSGKTYTMEGPAHITDFVEESDSPFLGMIPRAVTQVFTTAHTLAVRGWEYKMEVSILEIYNEILQDLLSTDSKSSQLSLQKGTDSAIANTTTRPVTCEREVYRLLKLARKHRVVAATSCNEHSSRSHSIFRLKITGQNSRTGESCEGVLSLVDLAGSERLKEQSISNSRLRETKNINKSLSNLGNVIMALAQKADHIPYRNSKLTHVLMNSLGGNSKTLMFVNISPKEENYTESLNSLRFGTQVNNCNIGTASKVVKKESF